MILTFNRHYSNNFLLNINKIKYNKYFINMTLRLIIVLAILFTLSNQLVNETSFTQNFPLISKLYFIEGKLFYISNDEASFGFINK